MISDVRNKFITHSGSIELQAQLEENPLILPSIILHEIEENAVMLCLDTYGNYVCQKVVSFLSYNQLLSFINSIANDFELIATSIPGSCVLTALMTNSYKDDSCKFRLLELFGASVCRLICDPQGSHLLQLMFDIFSKEELYFISETIEENFFIIATDRFGCCLIKKVIETESMDSLFSKVISFLPTLSNDQFGNYIIQFYFELKREKECAEIIDKLLPEMEVLSTQKYGSNVLEKIIETSENAQRNEIIKLLTETETKIVRLAENKFGNYVLQKCINCVGSEFRHLYEKVKRVKDDIQNEIIKQKIEDCIEQNLFI